MVQDTIIIPGEPDLFRTVNIPNKTVNLPLVARRSYSMIVVFVLFGFIALLFTFFIVGLLWLQLPQLLGADAVDLKDSAFWLAVMLMLLFGAIYLGGGAIMMMVDYLKPSPLLSIAQSGVRDARLAVAEIAWSDVASASVFYGKGGPSVRLAFRRPIRTSRNRFRLAGTPFSARSNPNQATVELAVLSGNEWELSQTILALVRQHGGRIEASS